MQEKSVFRTPSPVPTSLLDALSVGLALAKKEGNLNTVKGKNAVQILAREITLEFVDALRRVEQPP